MVDQVTLEDGSIITDDTNPTTGIRAGGHRNWFIKALQSVSTWASRAQSYAAQAQAAAGAGGGTIFPAVNSADAGKTLAINPAGTAYIANEFSEENFFINGDFQVWQDGTSFVPTTTPTYVADGFIASRTALTSGATISKQSWANAIALRVQRDSANASTATLNIATSLESVDVKKLAGKTVTFVFKALAGANYSATSGNLNVRVQYGTGTDSNPLNGFTTPTDIVSQQLTLSTTAQNYSVTATIPSNATQLGLIFGFTPVGTALANDYYEITGIGQLGYKRVSQARTEERCRRFYRKLAAMLYGQYGAAAQTIYVPVVHTPQMRATPAISFISPSYSNSSAVGSWVGSDANSTVLTLTITATGYGYVQTGIKLDARL